MYICIYVKASPLPPAPLAVAGFMVAGFALGNILIGSLACWVLLSVFCFAGNYCLLESLLVHWFLDFSFHAVILVFAVASLQPLSCATSDVTNHIFGMHKCNNIQI